MKSGQAGTAQTCFGTGRSQTNLFKLPHEIDRGHRRSGLLVQSTAVDNSNSSVQAYVSPNGGCNWPWRVYKTGSTWSSWILSLINYGPDETPTIKTADRD